MSSRVYLLATGTGWRPGLPTWILRRAAGIRSSCCAARQRGGRISSASLAFSPIASAPTAPPHIPARLRARPPRPPPKGRQNLQRFAGILADRLGHDIATPIAGVEPGRIHDRALAELAARVQ